MATLTDDFTGGYDSGVWDEFKSAGGTIAQANNQIETVAGASNTSLGLVAKTTYDLSAPSDIELDFIKVEEGIWVYIGANKAAATGDTPFGLDDWYRIGNTSGTAYAQKKPGAGSVTTIWSGARTATQVHKIDLPSTGDDVRFIVGVTEEASDATYALATRDLYPHIYARVITGQAGRDEGDFDSFSMTYTAVSGVTIPIMHHHYSKNIGSS